MEFKQVIQTCLNFAAANDGTIQSYPAGCKTNQLDIGPRTARTEIHIEQVQTGDWQVEQTQNAVGEKNNETREIVSTEQHLLEYLSRFISMKVEKKDLNASKACRLGIKL